MPIYEYECKKCGRMLEAYQKFADRPLNKCKECSGKLQRLISHSTFHLKGTGWYSTDYANRSGTPPASPEGKSKKATEEKNKKSDIKPASKGESGDSV